MVFGVTHLVIELVPYVQKTSIYRSFPLKVVTLLLQAFLSCLFYQVRVQSNPICILSISQSGLITVIRAQGTNGAVYSLTAAIGYGVASAKGEEMDVAKENRGSREGRA